MLLTCVLGSSEILSDIKPPLRFIRRQVTAVLLVRNYSYSKFVIKYFNSVVKVSSLSYLGNLWNLTEQVSTITPAMLVGKPACLQET